jgi:hypothetical protein
MASYVSHILTRATYVANRSSPTLMGRADVPLKELENRVIHLEAGRPSMQDIAEEYKRRSGGQAEIVRRPAADYMDDPKRATSSPGSCVHRSLCAMLY